MTRIITTIYDLSRTWLTIAILSVAPAIQAQTDHNPANSATPASTLRYDSVFDDYQALRDESLRSWREVNDEVGRIGGHVGAIRNSGDGTLPADMQHHHHGDKHQN